MDNETTLHYAALISQLIIHAKRVVRELDPTQELEQLRKWIAVPFVSFRSVENISPQVSDRINTKLSLHLRVNTS